MPLNLIEFKLEFQVMLISDLNCESLIVALFLFFLFTVFYLVEFSLAKCKFVTALCFIFHLNCKFTYLIRNLVAHAL